MSLGRVSGIRNGMLRQLAKKVTVPTLVKKSSKSRSFHFRYLELCRNKNLTPLPEIRKKSHETTLLELYADKLTVSDWLLIIEAIHNDLALKTLVLRMRRSYQHNTIDPIDTENRARRFTQRPVVFTRFIFRALVQAISNCVLSNKNLTVLKLEGLPLYEGYIEGIAKSLAGNDRLETLSFRRSMLGDKGCQLVCNTAKYLNRISIIDLSECHITYKGAVHVADMIKMQKISRYTEGWEKSLRYQTPDVNSLLGLRTVLLGNNPNIGDKGLTCIAEVLKEDAWIKVVDMQGCGLTDTGANVILGLLDLNSFIKEFNVRNNEGISQSLHRTIHDRLAPAENEEKQEVEFDSNWFKALENGNLPQGKKFALVQLISHAKLIEEQLSFERALRKKAEDLNVKLSNQLMCRNSQMACNNVPQAPDMPKDYMEMKKDVKVPPTYRQKHMTNEYLEMKEDVKESPTYRQMHNTNEYLEMGEEYLKESPTYRQTLIDSSVTTPEMSPRSDLNTLRQNEESEEPDSRSQPMEPMDFSHLEVRKVRSEMKYVESNVNEAKKNRESKSDHEFANELHFKLKSMVQFEQDIGDTANVSANQQKRDRYEGAGDEKFNSNEQFEQHIGTTVMVKGGHKQGRGRNDGGGDGKFNSMEQIKQPIKNTVMVKAGHKEEHARNDGGGDGKFNSMEQFEQHIGPTIMIKDGHKQEKDRNDGGGDGKRCKQAKQRRRGKMPDRID